MSETSNQDYYWYKKDNSDLYKSVFGLLKYLDSNQGYRQDENIKYMRMYGNYDFTGLRAYNYASQQSSGSVQNRVTLNIVQSMVDTVISKITKNKPKPYFLTDGGDFTLQRRAQKLTQFVEGQFYATEFHAKAARAFGDSCIFGTGAVKIYRSGAEIKVERTFIDEIKVVDEEAYYGDPRQMHQNKWIHKDVLKTMFPKKKSVIDAAAGASVSGRDSDFVFKQGDMLLVVESWKLPSGKDSGDGKHSICISNETLWSEEWAKDYFPFVFFRWNLKPLGFFGQGIAEQLVGLQLEINKILRTIQVSMHLVSVPKIFVDVNSNIVSSHLNNSIGGVIKFSGTPPIPGQLGTIPAELFSHLDRLYSRAYEIIGISQLSAQSQKPTGLDSGKALRTFNDLETERFMSCAQRYEQAYLDASKQMIDLAKEIADETNNYEMKVPGSGFLKTLKWDDVQMDDDKYLLQIFPTSALSTTPSARLQEVQEMLQAGFIDKATGMKLLDFPDLKAFYNMANAGLEDIERQIELIVDGGEYQSPEPYQNLQVGIQKMQQAYLMYRSQNAPEETLEKFRQWISDADDLLRQANQSQMDQAAQAQAGAVPQLAAPADATIGQPAAQPTSDLMPIA